MNLKERSKLFKRMMQEDYELQEKKGHDYSTNKDALSNLRKRGLQGILIRLEDKLSRLESFLEKGIFEVKDESVIDTLRDIRVYAYLAQIFYEEEKNQTITFHPLTLTGEFIDPWEGGYIEYDEKTGLDKEGKKVT